MNDPIAVASTPFNFPALSSQTSAAQALTDALNKAGAYAVAGGSATVRRDSIDQRAVTDVINGTGNAFLSNESQVGGYPTYNSGTPYPDTDGDGMSDAWETAHGLNPNDASDGPTLTANGYTNLENFLNELAGDNIPGQTPATFVAHYPFESDATGDAEGGHADTLVGSPTFSGGRVGKALVLNGSSQYVEVARAANLEPTTAMTMALWFDGSSLNPNTNFGDTLISKGDSNGALGYGLVFYQDQLRCFVGRSWAAGVGVLYAASHFQAGQWYHLACRADANGHTLFVNGQPVASSSVAAQAVNASSYPLRLGVNSAALVGHFAGSLDDVRLYTRALSDTDIQALASLGVGLMPPTALKILSK